jgi:hypothetical protein
VVILDADTTEIAVKKSLADKLGITNFENHPLRRARDLYQ